MHVAHLLEEMRQTDMDKSMRCSHSERDNYKFTMLRNLQLETLTVRHIPSSAFMRFATARSGQLFSAFHLK
jgi:hypothetical protein